MVYQLLVVSKLAFSRFLSFISSFFLLKKFRMNDWMDGWILFDIEKWFVDLPRAWRLLFFLLNEQEWMCYSMDPQLGSLTSVRFNLSFTRMHIMVSLASILQKYIATANFLKNKSWNQGTINAKKTAEFALKLTSRKDLTSRLEKRPRIRPSDIKRNDFVENS